MKNKIILAYIAMSILTAVGARAQSSTELVKHDCKNAPIVCDSNKSKPCGGGCIPLVRECRKTTTPIAIAIPGGRSACKGAK